MSEAEVLGAGADETAPADEGGEEAGPAPAPRAAPAGDGARYNDRLLVIGPTGSGKSEHINVLFSQLRPQRVLIDTKHEFAIPGVEPVSDVAAIDWRQPVIHYRDQAGTIDEFDELFAAFNQRRHLVVAVHELGDLCQHQPNRTPTAVRNFLTKGRAHGLGLIGGSQRPVMIPSHAYTEAMHIFVFVPRLSARDLGGVAREMGMGQDELAAAIDDVHQELGDHAFLWWNRRTRELAHCEPLPDHIRRRTLIRRTTVA